MSPLADQLRPSLGEKQNSSDSDSIRMAALAGLQPGMLVQEVNRQAIGDEKDFHKQVRAAQSAKRLLLRVRDGRSARYVVIELEQ